MKDIHGIRPPVSVGIDPLLLKIIFLVSGGILVFVLLFFLIRKYLKKRKRSQNLKYLPEPLAPYDAALKDLDRLSQRQFFEPRLFYFDLTAVLRKYIGRSFNINAIEMTSQEFVKGINLLDFETTTKKDIIGFQKFCDPVKYAGITPENDRIIKDISFTRKVIQKIEQGRVKIKDTFEETK
ncbi:hypothetical protein [Desulfobacula sp.]